MRKGEYDGLKEEQKHAKKRKNKKKDPRHDQHSGNIHDLQKLNAAKLSPGGAKEIDSKSK